MSWRVSLSTHLKVVFYMKCWIPPRSCSFQLTQCWSTPTRRTNVYRDWFRDSGNKKNIFNSNFTSQNAKIALQNQKKFLPATGYKPHFTREIIAKLLCDDNSNADKHKSYEISGQIFGLISSFLGNRRLWMVLDGKSSQEYPVNAGVPQGSILGPTLFLLYINDLPDDVICDIAIYVEDTAQFYVW